MGTGISAISSGGNRVRLADDFGKTSGASWASFPVAVDSKSDGEGPGDVGAGGAVWRYGGHPGPEAHQGR